MGELLKRVASEARTDEFKCPLRKVGSAFLTHREVSAQESTVYTYETVEQICCLLILFQKRKDLKC